MDRRIVIRAPPLLPPLAPPRAIALLALLSLAMLLAGAWAPGGASAQAPAPVVTPRVHRPADAGEPVVWPLYGAETGDNTIRNCGWWSGGWDRFAEERGLPAAERFGRLWLHNPGGVVTGEPMKFDQFSEAAGQARLTGDAQLANIADTEAFTRAMNRIAAKGRLAIYLGAPDTMRPAWGESDDEWLERARRELAPILAIQPKPILAFDAVYGQPAVARLPWRRFGGPGGLTARLLNELHDRGYELLVEPSILRRATWLRDRAGVVATEFWWDRLLRGRDFASPHENREWGVHLKPTEITHRQARYLSELWKKPKEEQWPLVEATLDAGYDVVVSAIECPGYPFVEGDAESPGTDAPEPGRPGA